MALVGPDGITPVTSSDIKTPETVSPFTVSVLFNRSTGLGTVKMKQPGGGLMFVMTPLEARMLGVDLIVKSEGAITNAITMRVLTEPSMGNMPIEQAVEVIDVLGRATRDVHNIAELEYQQKRATDAREKQSSAGETAPPGQVSDPQDGGKV